MAVIGIIARELNELWCVNIRIRQSAVPGGSFLHRAQRATDHKMDDRVRTLESERWWPAQVTVIWTS